MLFRNLLPANLGHENRHENPHISNSQSSEWINKWNVPSTDPRSYQSKSQLNHKSQSSPYWIASFTSPTKSPKYLQNYPFFLPLFHSSKRFPTKTHGPTPNPAHFSWSKSSAMVSKPAAPEAPSKPFVAAAPGMEKHGKTWVLPTKLRKSAT